MGFSSWGAWALEHVGLVAPQHTKAFIPCICPEVSCSASSHHYVPIHQPDWLPPSIHSDWCACLLCTCSGWPEHSLSSFPLARPSPIVYSDWLLSDAHSDWSVFIQSHSVVSDSLQCHGLYNPWNALGQNTGVGSLSPFQGSSQPKS